MGKQVNQFLKEWNEAKNDEQKRRDLAEDIWYDWFCSSTALYNRTKKFIKPLKIMVKKNPKVGELELSGKNCCPVSGSLYDVLRLFNAGEEGRFCGYIAYDFRGPGKFQVALRNVNEKPFDTIEEAAEYLACSIK